LKKEVSTASLASILDQTMEDPSHHLATDLNFKNYMINHFEVNKFSEELATYLTNILNEEKTKWDAIFKTDKNKKTLAGDKVKVEQELTDKISFAINEIMMARKSFDLSSDVKEAVTTAVSNALRELIAEAPDELMDQTMDWWTNLINTHGLS
jgi:hypothetical protein